MKQQGLNQWSKYGKIPKGVEVQKAFREEKSLEPPDNIELMKPTSSRCKQAEDEDFHLNFGSSPSPAHTDANFGVC